MCGNTAFNKVTSQRFVFVDLFDFSESHCTFPRNAVSLKSVKALSNYACTESLWILFNKYSGTDLETFVATNRY